MTTAEQILDLVNRPPVHEDPATKRLILLTDIENCVLGSGLVREAQKNAEDSDYSARQYENQVTDLEGQIEDLEDDLTAANKKVDQLEIQIDNLFTQKDIDEAWDAGHKAGLLQAEGVY